MAWYDRPIMRSEGVGTAVCAVGALVPGYLLVSPAQHESSVQALTRPTAVAFLSFLADVHATVERHFGPTTIFEHGSCRSEERRRSACISHSHVHLVPGRYALEQLGLPVRRFETLTGIVDIPPTERNQGYLMYREPDGMVCYAPDAGISQFFRRHIAKMLGRPDEWDYALFPDWANLRATQEALGSGSAPQQFVRARETDELLSA
ncbi:hypothetical protein SAMN05421812_104541 [Asanoa hainanensis]|uniref:Diadenosine tetraphosphate (Ap4A) hydrolase n=1 Tax=Asanoa hainanensis TaxID=560556 RepID=A0A239LTF1_9ACTN|nr:hypothetical protein SAMN05421812_104541 [Asanoa hainanensis]